MQLSSFRIGAQMNSPAPTPRESHKPSQDALSAYNARRMTDMDRELAGCLEAAQRSPGDPERATAITALAMEYVFGDLGKS